MELAAPVSTGKRDTGAVPPAFRVHGKRVRLWEESVRIHICWYVPVMRHVEPDCHSSVQLEIRTRPKLRWRHGPRLSLKDSGQIIKTQLSSEVRRS